MDKDEEIRWLKERIRNLRIGIYDILVISLQTNESHQKVEQIKQKVYKIMEIDNEEIKLKPPF
jgi:hypothetical protein